MNQSSRKYLPEVTRGGVKMKLSCQFSYTLSWLPLVPSTNPTLQSFQVQNDSDFLWIGTSYSTDVAAAAQTYNSLPMPLIAVSMLLVAEPFMDSETPITGIAGSAAEKPILLPEPFWIPGGATFKVQARNYSAAGNYNLWIAFHGLKYKKTEG
jgi:hypothetical protein